MEEESKEIERLLDLSKVTAIPFIENIPKNYSISSKFFTLNTYNEEHFLICEDSDKRIYLILNEVNKKAFNSLMNMQVTEYVVLWATKRAINEKLNEKLEVNDDFINILESDIISNNVRSVVIKKINVSEYSVQYLMNDSIVDKYKIKVSTFNILHDKIINNVQIDKNKVYKFNYVINRVATEVILFYDVNEDINLIMKVKSKVDSGIINNVNDLSLTDDELTKVKNVVNYNSGLIIVAGQFNSGKSTTLNILLDLYLKENNKYCVCLSSNKINKLGDNTITCGNIDDVEPLLEGVNGVVYIDDLKNEDIPKILRLCDIGFLVFCSITINDIASFKEINFYDEIIKRFKLLIFQKSYKKLCDCKTSIALSDSVYQDEFIEEIGTNQMNGITLEYAKASGCNNCIDGYNKEFNILFEVVDTLSTNSTNHETFEKKSKKLFLNKEIDVKTYFKLKS